MWHSVESFEVPIKIATTNMAISSGWTGDVAHGYDVKYGDQGAAEK